MKKFHAALALLALLVAAAPVAAQKRIQVTPFYGYVYPQGELPAAFALDKTGGNSVDIFDGEFESRTAFYGGTIALELFKHVNLEGTVMTGTDKLVATRLPETDVKILAYSGGISLDLPRMWRIEPFLLGGVGVKSYDFDIPETKAEKDLEFNFGAGVNFELFNRLALNVQARDMMSEFSSSLDGIENEKQNDLLFAAGLTFTFGGKGTHVAAVQH